MNDIFNDFIIPLLNDGIYVTITKEPITMDCRFVFTKGNAHYAKTVPDYVILGASSEEILTHLSTEARLTLLHPDEEMVDEEIRDLERNFRVSF